MPCTDDPAIGDDDDLWRRIAPDWVVLDENEDQERGGRVRPSSAAFRDRSLSVLLAREDTHERALAGWQERGFSLAAITAGLARQHRQSVCREPTKDDPAHAVVEGKKKGRVDEKLAIAAKWVGETPPHTKVKAKDQ